MPGAAVECYSGHTYAQEPRFVVWQGQRHRVSKVSERWHTPGGPAFEVQTESGLAFKLAYNEHQDLWTITTVPTTASPIAKKTGRSQTKMRSFVAKSIENVPPSGIRRFFDIAATMDDVISLGIGEPDFDTPPAIVQAGIASLSHGHTHYTSNSGIMELRVALSDHLAGALRPAL